MISDGFWFSLAAVAAVLNWISADRGWRRLVYLTKPAVMWIFLIILFRTGEVPGRLTGFFIGAALGLAGDTFLMLPGKRMFVYGLLAFLTGHLAYIIAFQPHPWTHPLIELAMALVLGTAAVLFGHFLSRNMQCSSLNRMRIPILVYLLTIGIMAWSAAQTLLNPRWTLTAALLVSTGALLFLVSDSLLAWDRFVRPLPHARLLVIVTYHLAQAGILVGAALNLQTWDFGGIPLLP